ncbi:hypothetical protein [Actinocorallia populi]|uniref:hypothetical protein n=1 Tax=Actinocorallia populi TaxID=2079200 RepID=UPI000D087941|nr:hypothetical protein [Actinocorallia populi]
MSGTHRATSGRSRRKKNSGKALPAILAAVVAVIAIGVVVFLVRPGGEEEGAAGRDVPAAAKVPRTGTQLKFTSTEDFDYSMGAIRTGLDSGRAYAEYLVTNDSGRTAPFEAPAQLYLPAADAGTDRCAPQAGVSEGMCNPPTESQIVGVVGDAQPSPDGVDQYMPAGASFIVRVSTEQPVAQSARPDAIRLYIWDVRFVTNRIAQPLPLP